MRWMIVAVAVLCAMPVQAEEMVLPYIEAWCDGGFDGRYQHVTVEPAGTIRATKQWNAEKPWPVVAEDSLAAIKWFEAIEEAGFGVPEGLGSDATDAINCGMMLVFEPHRGALVHLPEIQATIVRYAPDFH